MGGWEGDEMGGGKGETAPMTVGEELWRFLGTFDL